MDLTLNKMMAVKLPWKLWEEKIFGCDEALLHKLQLVCQLDEVCTQADNPLLQLYLSDITEEKKKDKKRVIEAFCLSLDNGMFPQKWVLDELRACFGEYVQNHGHKSLDDCFELSAEEHRKGWKQERDDRLLHVCTLLKYYFGLPKRDIAEIAFKTAEYDKLRYESTGHSIEDVSVKTIYDYFSPSRMKEVFSTLPETLEKIAMEKDESLANQATKFIENFSKEYPMAFKLLVKKKSRMKHNKFHPLIVAG